MADAGGCLFLEDWEAARGKTHAERRQHAERTLWDIGQRARGGLAAVDAWLAVLQSRRALEEAAASAAARGVDELEARWRQFRVDAHDGEAAAWLLDAERAHAAALAAHAQAWAAVVPPGAAELRKRLQALVAEAGGWAEALRAWDAAHDAAATAWREHCGRLQAASRAVVEERAPPDSWLSEVRYRERARAHLAQQAAAERLLEGGLGELRRLEVERAGAWTAYADAYRGAVSATSGAAVAEVPPVAPPGVQGEAPPPQLPELPEMPCAGGVVLQRCRAAMQAPAGLFGFGGGGWKEGAVLVLTLHGYLHLFFFATGAAGDAEEELVESAIKASVYVPMATKCMFLRKGKELIVDLAEAPEAAMVVPEAASAGGAAEASGLGKAASGGLRRLLGRGSAAEEPMPRRVYARMEAVGEFSELEGRCHEFVRRGQGLRSQATAAAAAEAARAAAAVAAAEAASASAGRG